MGIPVTALTLKAALTLNPRRPFRYLESVTSVIPRAQANSFLVLNPFLFAKVISAL